MQAISEINHSQPDMIILTGDITGNGYYVEFQQATKYLELFEAPLFAVPGNHDARNLGYQTFEELIGEKSWKLTVGENFTVIGLDSSSPDENRGHIGNPQHMWLEHQLDECVINENTRFMLEQAFEQQLREQEAQQQQAMDNAVNMLMATPQAQQQIQQDAAAIEGAGMPMMSA